jgi:hypothetical protein
MSRLLFASVIAILGGTLALTGGCSSSSANSAASDASTPAEDATSPEAGADAPAGPDPQIAISCTAYATAYCALLTKCYDAEPVMRFGKKDNCIPRVALDCKTRFGLTDVAVTTTALDACTTALPGASCAGALNDFLPSACDLAAGKRTNGQPCFDRAQCSSGHCEPAKAGASCGACADPPALGAKCSAPFQDNGCGAQQFCENDTCGKLVALGDACDASNHCGADLSCLKGKCVKAANIGDTCDLADPNAPGCAWAEACNPVCQPITALEYDATECAIARTVCGGHAVCDTTCVPPPVEGKACGTSSTFAEKCQWPSVCEGGQCVLGTSTSCK